MTKQLAPIETIRAGDVIRDNGLALMVIHARRLSHSTYLRTQLAHNGVSGRTDIIGAHNGHQVEVISRYVRSEAEYARSFGEPPREDDSQHGLETQECSP